MHPVTPADDYDAVTARLLRQTTDELRRERDAMRAELHAARARLALLESVLQGTEAHLAALQSGLGWAVLRRFRSVKGRLLAPGSPAERAYGRLTRRVARRLDGP